MNATACPVEARYRRKAEASRTSVPVAWTMTSTAAAVQRSSLVSAAHRACKDVHRVHGQVVVCGGCHADFAKLALGGDVLFQAGRTIVTFHHQTHAWFFGTDDPGMRPRNMHTDMRVGFGRARCEG